MEINELFWKNVNAILKERGMSQVDFATTINVGVRTYQDWVYSKRIPDMEKTKRIADSLGVSIDYLLHESDYNEKNLLNEQERVIIECFRKMPNAVKTHFVHNAIYFSKINENFQIEDPDIDEMNYYEEK